MKLKLASSVFYVFYFLLVSHDFFGQIIFDGGSHYGGPPTTLGGFEMTQFPFDGRMDKFINHIDLPNAPCSSKNSLLFDQDAYKTSFSIIGQGYNAYNNYFNTLSLELPSETKSFYFYVLKLSDCGDCSGGSGRGDLTFKVNGSYPIPMSQMNEQKNDNEITNSENSVLDVAPIFYGFYTGNSTEYINRIDITYTGIHGYVIGAFGINRTMTYNAPKSLKISNSNCNAIDLNWEDIIRDTEESYELYRSTNSGAFELIATPAANSISYTDQNLQPNKSYTYFIRGRFGCGFSPWSNFASGAIFCNTREGPKNLIVSQPKGGYLLNILSWQNVPDALSYEVYRSADGPNGNYILKSEYSQNLGSYSLFPDSFYSNEPLITYYYYVRAKLSEGFSAPSNIASGMPIPIPKINLSIMPFGCNSLQINWDKIELHFEEAFLIYRSTSANGPFQLIGQPTSSSGTTQFIDNNLESNKTYFYKIEESNWYHSSPIFTSDLIESRTNCNNANFGNLNANTLNCSQIKLNWIDIGYKNEESYEIYRSKISAGPYTLVGMPIQNATEWVDVQLNSNTNYYYKIRARFNDGFSNYSSIAFSNTMPINLMATTVSNTAVRLEWEICSPEREKWIIKASTDNINFYDIGEAPSLTSHFEVTNLFPNTNYTFVIQPIYANGFSNWSNPVSIKTPMPSAVNTTEEIRIVAYSNPTTDEFNFKINADILGQIELVVVDNFGNIQIKKHEENLEMNKEYKIGTSKLREGNYLLYIVYNNIKQPFFVKFNKKY